MRKYTLLTIGILMNTICFSQQNKPLRVEISTICDYHLVMVWNIDLKTGILNQSCYSLIENANEDELQDTTFIFNDLRILKRLAKQVSKDQNKIDAHFHGIHEIYLRFEFTYEDHSETVNFFDYSKDELKEVHRFYLKFYKKYFEQGYKNFDCYGHYEDLFP